MLHQNADGLKVCIKIELGVGWQAVEEGKLPGQSVVHFVDCIFTQSHVVVCVKRSGF